MRGHTLPSTALCAMYAARLPSSEQVADPSPCWRVQVTLSRAKIGFFWLLLSFASLSLTFLIWVGTPTSAFTNVCQPCDTPGLCPKDYSCMQLDGGLCPQVTASQGQLAPLGSTYHPPPEIHYHHYM